MSKINNEDIINAEARLIAYRMFGLYAVSDSVIVKYNRANELLLSDKELYQGKIMKIDFDKFIRYSVLNSVDLCSVEYYLRLRDRTNILTKKTKVMSYLLETECKSSKIFRSFSTISYSRAIISLMFIGLISVLYLIKGWLLTRRVSYCCKQL